MVLSPDRRGDKFIKSWRRNNLLVKRCQLMPGRSCKRVFSALNTHDTAYATHNHLLSLAPIYLDSNLNIIFNDTRCQVSPLWVFMLLWVPADPTLQGWEELCSCHPSWVHWGLALTAWKYRKSNSKGFQFCPTNPTKAGSDKALKHCCVIPLKAGALLLALLCCWSNLSLLSAQGVSQDSPRGTGCSDCISQLMSIWGKGLPGRHKEAAAMLLAKYQSFDQSYPSLLQPGMNINPLRSMW